MRPEPYYTRSETETLFQGLRHEIRADLNGLRAEMAQRFGAVDTKIESVKSKIEGLRGEIRVWFLVFAIIVTPVVTSLVNRVTIQAWPTSVPQSSQLSR